MKKLFTLLLLISGVAAVARPLADSTTRLLYDAKVMANPKSPIFKPDKSFQIYSKLALQGNAEAMNGLGMLYSKGIGRSVDDREAFNWFTKSANSGYGNAFYNLALIYKDGTNGQQDFFKAYQLYCQGAALNNGMCIYGKGYMLYKGYGCAQSYEQAVVLFKKGAIMRDEGSYYMLGLCYRNGYGIAVNLDSAKYWLNKAAAWKDQRAIRELADGSPENLDLHDVPNLQAQATSNYQPVDLKTGYKPVKHHVIAKDITGDYNGYAIKFDWSGKHIIGQAALKLRLELKDKVLTGEWQEEGQVPFSISGTLNDTALVFDNNEVKIADHYHKENPLSVILKDSKLNLANSKDTVFLSGTVRLYSPQLKEPQRPEFMMLIRTGNKYNEETDTSFNRLADTKTDSLHFIAYPNPFAGTLQLRYTLKKSARVSILVSNLLTGGIVYRSAVQEVNAGDHTSPVNFDGLPGNYVVTLQYDNKIKSAIVFKQ